MFSWQTRPRRVGVVSSYRFLEGLEDFYEPEVLATRRLGIQVISTTSSLLGFERPTLPQCPDAYLPSLEEFLQKGTKLCDSTVAQRDVLLRRAGGTPAPMGSARAAEITRVHARYAFE